MNATNSRNFLSLLAGAGLLVSTAANSQEPQLQTNQVTGASINGVSLIEDSCEVLAAAQGQKAELREVPGLHVLDKTPENPLVLTPAPDVKISGIMCWRSEARLAPNDYLVPLKNGFSFYVKTDTGDESKDRTIALEKASGSFRVRLLSGPDWSASEEDEVQKAIQLYIERAAFPAGAPATSAKGATVTPTRLNVDGSLFNTWGT